jgi:hypothetical protein
MSYIAIRVENLGKLYRIGAPPMQLVCAPGEDECGY